MLTILLSAFFMFSCGDDGGSAGGGITEAEFYKTVAVQTCEKGFKCDIEYLKAGKTDISECKEQTSQGNCPYEFDGVKAKECNECAGALTCEEYDEGRGEPAKCPVCSQVCSVKM